MDEEDFAARQRGEDAARWFARLKTVPVSQGTLNDFFAWRRDPDNAKAFEEAERFWSTAAKVGERPAILRAIEQAEARSQTRRRAPRIPRALAVLAIGCAGLLLVFAGIGAFSTKGETFSTPPGEQRMIALADGSRLNLNVETAVRVKYTAEARQLELRSGEAVFQVAHNRTRPFTVTAGGVTVTATGTRFDVALRAKTTFVTLIEGSVLVRAADGKTIRLSPGEQWRSSAGAATLERVNAEAVTAWTQGRIIFDNAPLADAVAEINRHRGRQIVLGTPQLGTRRISGSFEAGDSESFAAAVSALLPVEQTFDKAGRIRLSERITMQKENDQSR